MLNSLNWTVALATASLLFMTKTAFSQPPTVSYNYPVVPASDTDQLVCYMQTVDGKTLNLSRLCGKKTSVQSQLLLSGVVYEDDNMIGHVINKSSQTVYQSRVNYEVIGENGSVIDRGTLATDPPTLSPGQVGTFQAFLPGGRQVRTTPVEGDEKQ